MGGRMVGSHGEAFLGRPGHGHATRDGGLVYATPWSCWRTANGPGSPSSSAMTSSSWKNFAQSCSTFLACARSLSSSSLRRSSCTKLVAVAPGQSREQKACIRSKAPFSIHWMVFTTSKTGETGQKYTYRRIRVQSCFSAEGPPGNFWMGSWAPAALSARPAYCMPRVGTHVMATHTQSKMTHH